jgi:SAM-dependent methyltransferase
VEAPDVERVRWFLKSNTKGPKVEEALRERIGFHLKDPALDPLLRQVWDSYQDVLQHLEEPFTILDAGCMTGFFYHHLKKNKKDFKYTGIDVWPEAIKIAKEFATGVDFRFGDFRNFNEQFDYVWCSNIRWMGNDLELAKKNLSGLARRKLIFANAGQELEIYGA